MKILPKPKPPRYRGTGVTIMMNHQIFCTSTPNQEDSKFVQQAVFWIQEYQKGSPNA